MAEKKTIADKIGESVTAATGLPFYYDTAQTLNLRLDFAQYPCAMLFVVETGAVDDENGVIRERLTCNVLFTSDQTQLDFDGLQNEKILDGLKVYAFRWLQYLRRADGLRLVSINSTQRLYATNDAVLTAYAVGVTIDEIHGVSGCDDIAPTPYDLLLQRFTTLQKEYNDLQLKADALADELEDTRQVLADARKALADAEDALISYRAEIEAGKKEIADAITAKGVPTDAGDSLENMAANVLKIETQPERQVKEATFTLSGGVATGSGTARVITWYAANGAIKMEQSKGQGSTDVGAGYIAQPRIYKGQILTFETPGAESIVRVAVTYAGQYKGNEIFANTEINAGGGVTDDPERVAKVLATTNNGTHEFASVSSQGVQRICLQNGRPTDSQQWRITAVRVEYME